MREAARTRLERIDASVMAKFGQLVKLSEVHLFDGQCLMAFFAAFASAKVLPKLMGKKGAPVVYDWAHKFCDGISFVKQHHESPAFASPACDSLDWKACLDLHQHLKFTTVPKNNAEEISEYIGEEVHTDCLNFSRRACELSAYRNVAQRMSSIVRSVSQEWRAMSEQLINATPDIEREVEEKYNALLAMARDASDAQLQDQINFLRDADCCKAQLAAIQKKKQASTTRGELAVSDAWLDLLKPLHPLAKGLRAQAARDGYVRQLFATSGDHDLHLDIFDNSLGGEEIMRFCLSCYDDLYGSLISQWSTDLGELSDKVSAMCPAWQALAKDPALLSKDNVKRFLTNPDYGKISPSCGYLQQMLDLNKKFAQGSADAIFTPEAAKKASDIIKLGYDTVSFTYGIFHAYIEIPKLATVELKKAAVASLRAALKAKRFVNIPLALENRLQVLDGSVDLSKAPTLNAGAAAAEADGQS